MPTGALLYEGKAKKVFATDKPDQVVQYFKDDATAFNAQKRGTIVEKGIINNKVSKRLFLLLEQAGVPTQFVERPGGDDDCIAADGAARCFDAGDLACEAQARIDLQPQRPVQQGESSSQAVPPVASTGEPARQPEAPPTQRAQEGEQRPIPPRTVTFDDGDDLDVPDFLK